MKPRLWPWIEFFSSRGQESRCLRVIQQQPFNHPYGRKPRGTKKLIVESESESSVQSLSPVQLFATP